LLEKCRKKVESAGETAIVQKRQLGRRAGAPEHGLESGPVLLGLLIGE